MSILPMGNAPNNGSYTDYMRQNVLQHAQQAGMGTGGTAWPMPTSGTKPYQDIGGAAPQPPTRQENMQSVTQAYARMPGDMNALNGLIGQSQSPVSANDPSIAPAFAAGRVADTRNIERQRAALAEQLGGAGLGSSGAMQTKLGGIQQRVGEQQALRESGMLYDESNARRNALLQALGLDQNRYQGDNQIGLSLAQLIANMNQNATAPFLS